ncbi:hypothetical protein V6N11_002867 [Hibiscus sabdariffa]|uniref:Phytocyanin domain-containing protein n=1 Tax=Hibiscus sabdariffa TaxID=183260 RepID=A0ABR2SBK7_9ROSI
MNGSVEASKQFTVGDHIGWRQPSSNNSDVYTLWATSKRFHVGDSLSFEYDRNDSVLVVDKWDYYHCNSNNPIYSFNDGSNVVNLDRPGSFYFISGILDHCKNGEKLMIQVMGLHQRAEPPPATANPREVGLAPGPHPSSGIVVTVALTSVCLALIITVVALAIQVGADIVKRALSYPMKLIANAKNAWGQHGKKQRLFSLHECRELPGSYIGKMVVK